MLVLPSGHVVGITSERARHHATRQNMHVTRETTLHELYRLVDIVYADEKRDSNDLSQGYRFTGYTVSDYQWISKWREEDRTCFLHWINQGSQQQVIEGARRKLIYDTLPHQVQAANYPERLYSVLRRRIGAMEMKSASAAQWRSTILNMKHCGVREDEINWSGILAVLDHAETQREGHITREELLSRVDFSEIRIELTNELVRDEKCHLPFRERAYILPARQLKDAGISLTNGEVPVVRYQDSLLGYRILSVWRRGSFGSARRWLVLDPGGSVLADHDHGQQHFDNCRHAMEVANDHAVRNHGLSSPLRPNDKYEYMSLHGGMDYREWIVTLPDYQHSHFTPHFTERNVLLHFRTKTRCDQQGNRLLFVEEIQSDWHQSARKGRGSRTQGRVPQAPFHKEWSLLAVKLLLMHAVKEGYDRMAWSPGQTQQMRYQCDLPALRRFYDREIPQHLEQLSKAWDGKVESTLIDTKEPWLSARRSGGNWSVCDRSGSFITRKALSKEQAVALCERHTKSIELEVPLFRIPEAMSQRIRQDALPLFGTMIIDKVKRPLCGVDGFKECDEKTKSLCMGRG
ncbi:MAG: hypothetical protein ABW116_04170 [Candidatus Sedimenticola sp. 20ELBAFRAG]